MTKLAIKLLILIAILVTVAGLCGGWKWDTKPHTTRAADYALTQADPNGPVSSTPTDTPSTLAPADPNGPVSSTPTDTALTPDGWTWD